MKEVNEDYENELDNFFEIPEFTPQQVPHELPESIDTDLIAKVDSGLLMNQLRTPVGMFLRYGVDKKTGDLTEFNDFIEQRMIEYYKGTNLFLKNEEYVNLGMAYNKNTKTWILKDAPRTFRMAVKRQIEATIPSIVNERNYKAQKLKPVMDELMEEIADSSYNVNPFDPDKIMYLVGLPNGKTYDFKTNTVVDSEQEHYITSRLETSLVETVDENNILKGLLEYLLGESYLTVMQFIGYTFVRTYKLNQSIMIFTDDKLNDDVRNGGNGKSTVQGIINKIFGHQTTSFKLKSLSDDRFATSGFYGFNLAIDPDASSDMMRDISNIKALTGNDSISAQFKNKDSFTFTNYAKLLFSANDLPRFYENSDAINDRLLPIGFTKNVRGNQVVLDEIEELFPDKDRFTPHNLGQFMYMCIQEFRKIWFKDGHAMSTVNFYKSQSTNKLLSFWNKHNDNLTPYLDEYFIYTDDENDKVHVKMIDSLYDKYCDENNIQYNDRKRIKGANGLEKIQKSLETTFNVPKVRAKKAQKTKETGSHRKNVSYFVGVKINPDYMADYSNAYKEWCGVEMSDKEREQIGLTDDIPF